MKAIILSAGQGSRLLPLTADRPKCLIEVGGGVTLLGWQLAELSRAGIEEAVVVTGYRAELVEAEIARHRGRMTVRTVRNEAFAQTDNLASAWQARDEMHGDFLLLNGDTLFVPQVVARLRAAPPVPVRVVVSRKGGYDEDDMKVSLDAGGRLAAIGKNLAPALVHAESIGMILFRGAGADRFRHAADAAMTGDRPATRRYYLSLIDAMARRRPLDVLEAGADEWSEVDFPDDVAVARARVQAWRRAGRTGSSAAHPHTAVKRVAS